ncbi:MAG: AEC family transporter [Ideonella sp.]|nr:AEC family transporter [Ideonella sp.]MCC7455330.1 AEC family transporter [Nitrospira sp.]
MTWLVLQKLLAMFIVVALGWWAGRRRWLGEGDTARVLGNAAFMIFVPALLFRTAARLDLAALPWRTLGAYFVPALLWLFAVYGAMRWRGGVAAALPGVRAIGTSYGNAVQVGIPMAAALFGESGLGLHLTLVSLHGLVLLSVCTALVEHDTARSPQAAASNPWPTLLRNVVLHPVVLPLIAGLLFNAAGGTLPSLLDELLQLLGTAVVPVCLVLIGLSLQHYGFGGPVRTALQVSALKLLAMPALVLVVAHWAFGLTGEPLAVVVLMAALPVGSNALIFAQRYRCDEPEATTAVVVSTLAYALTAPLWLAALARL